MTGVEANPVFVGRIVDHGPTWKWFQFDMLRMELRAGDRLRVSCAQISPLRFGEILVIGVIDNLVYLSGSAFDGIAAIADLDCVYLVGRSEAKPAAPLLEDLIRDDVNEVIAKTGHMPKLAYVVSAVDAALIARRAHGGRPDSGRVELNIGGGWVTVIADPNAPRQTVRRAYLCSCSALFFDDNSRSGRCRACISGALWGPGLISEIVKDMQRAKAVGYLADKAVAPVPTLSARLGHLKHGPGGSGLSGPCDADCRKCAAERIMATDAARLKMASEMTIDPNAIRKAFNLPPAPAPKPVDPLDVERDGVKLRNLIDGDRFQCRELGGSRWRIKKMTESQRAAVSAHWSAELRAKVAASNERERNVVRVDLDDDAC